MLVCFVVAHLLHDALTLVAAVSRCIARTAVRSPPVSDVGLTLEALPPSTLQGRGATSPLFKAAGQPRSVQNVLYMFEGLNPSR